MYPCRAKKPPIGSDSKVCCFIRVPKVIAAPCEKPPMKTLRRPSARSDEYMPFLDLEASPLHRLPFDV